MDTLKAKAHSLLRSSEKIFKTDMVYLARGGFWLGLGQFMYALLAFALSLFFANVVEKDVYGTYKFVLSLTSLVGALTLSGMGSIVVQGVARGAEGTYKDALRVTLKWSGLLALTSLAVAFYYIAHHNYVVGVSMIVAAAALPIINTYGLYGSYLSGKKDFRGITLYGVASQAVINGAIILTTLLTKQVLPIVIVALSLNALMTFAYYAYTLRTYKPNDVRDPELIAYGKHLSYMGFFGTTANQLDKILVYHFLGAAPLAVYAFAQAIPDQAKGLLKSVFVVALPKYAESSDAAMRESIKRKAIQLTALTALGAFIYIVLARTIFHVLFPRYMDAVFYSQICMAALVTVPAISLYSTYFQLRKLVSEQYKLNIIGNVATILITIGLISRFGLLGAALENVFSWSVMLLAAFYYFEKDKKAVMLSS